jgi:hypothetical protein
MPFEPIENYGVIGNMQSIGLVGMNGSIDFLCYPNFDSPTALAPAYQRLYGIDRPDNLVGATCADPDRSTRAYAPFALVTS